MKLKEILAISGTPGLHQFIAQGRGGIIVESIVDTKRTMVSGAAKVSALGDIAVFTDTDEVSLGDIFTKIYSDNKGVIAIDGKSTNEELAKFFESILPNYDRDRVHMSDVKKIAGWYNILVGAGMTDFSVKEEEEAPVAEVSADGAAPVKKKAAPKKPATTAKAAPPKASGAKIKATKSTTNRKSQ